MDNDKDKKIIKSPYYSLEKLSKDSKLIKRGLRDLGVWPKIEDLFHKLEEKYSAGLIDECMELCLEVFAVEPYHYLTLVYYSWCLEDKGEYKKCVEYCTRCLNEVSDEQLTLRIRGNCYYAMKDYKKAIDDYKKILALDPDPINGSLMIRLARCSILLGDLKGAYDYIDQGNSIEKKSDSPMSKPFLLVLQEEIPEALEQYIETLSKSPKNEHAQEKIVDLLNKIVNQIG